MWRDRDQGAHNSAQVPRKVNPINSYARKLMNLTWILFLLNAGNAPASVYCLVFDQQNKGKAQPALQCSYLQWIVKNLALEERGQTNGTQGDPF
jgi:hypothetical protein